MSIPALCKASIVMPVNSGSVVPSKRFAEKPPETPAKAAARKALNVRVLMRGHQEKPGA